MLHGVEQDRNPRQSSGSRQRAVVDAVRIDGSDVWCFLAGPFDDPASWLFDGAEPVVVCRGIRADGTVRLGRVDQDRDGLACAARERCGG